MSFEEVEQTWADGDNHGDDAVVVVDDDDDDDDDGADDIREQ